MTYHTLNSLPNGSDGWTDYDQVTINPLDGSARISADTIVFSENDRHNPVLITKTVSGHISVCCENVFQARSECPEPSIPVSLLLAPSIGLIELIDLTADTLEWEAGS